MKFSRRQFIQGSLGLGALGMSSFTSDIQASIPASRRKFIFLRVPGGWDTTRVFAPMFSNPNIDMENEAELRIQEDIHYVSHPNRPEVDSYFQDFASQTGQSGGEV